MQEGLTEKEEMKFMTDMTRNQVKGQNGGEQQFVGQRAACR